MKRHYSINENNQLLIKLPNNKKAMAAIPVRGSFLVDKNNQLIYWLNEPAAWRRLYSLPSKLSFIGNWQLNSNYGLELNLDETKSQYKQDRLILKGEIISTDRDTLAFEIITHGKGLSPSELSRSRFKGTVPDATHIQIIKLSGSWQADELNRIIFTIDKRIAPDVITFKGSWQLNKNQQITYIYEKTNLKTKSRISRVLTFEGFWEINSSNRLAYILSQSTKSYFDFRVQFESPNMYPKEGVIKYRIGIGLEENKPSKAKTVCLYGSWRFSRKAGLFFQMDYGKGRFRDIEFGANIYLNKKDEVSFFLTDKKNEPLGLNITFTHKFIKDCDAEAFLRLRELLDKKDIAIEAGVRIPF